MELIIAFVVGAVCGAVGGVLIYRNNLKKLEGVVAELEKKFDDLKAKVGK